MLAVEERNSTHLSLLGKDEAGETSLTGRDKLTDSCFVQLVKRLYVISPLLGMSFSTINQVFAIGSNFASQTDTDMDYGREVQIMSDGEYTYLKCKNGDVNAVIAYCPYVTRPPFVSMLTLWVVYFVAFMLLRLWATSHYSTDDLRFYIATDRFNQNMYNRGFVIMGYLLTAVSVAVSLYYLSPQTDWNKTIDTATVINILVFTAINIIALQGFKHMTTNDNAVLDMQTEFPKPISLNKPASVLRKYCASVDSVIKPILMRYLQYVIHQDESFLNAHGHAPELIEAMNKLFKCN